MVKSEDKNIKIVEETIRGLLEKLRVEANVSVEKKDKEDYSVAIDTPESGLLIGHHGEVINSLQLLVGVMIFKKLGSWVRVLVDIGGYREKREESIKKLAQEKAAEAISSGQPVALPFLSPLERRIVHIALSENSAITSESEGEGKDRHIVIKPVSKV